MNATRIAPGRWRVQSERDPALSYSVQVAGEHGVCDCIAGVTHQTECKHVRWAREQENQMSENGTSSTAVAVRDKTIDYAPVVVTPPATLLPSMDEMKVMVTLANSVWRTRGKLLPKEIDSSEMAFAIMLAGRELGIPPMASFREMYVVNGRTVPSARVLMGLVLHGDPAAKFEWYERSPKKAHARLTRGNGMTLEVEYTIEDAQRAGLTKNSVWTAYPADMLAYRCVSRLCRLGGPDLITMLGASVRGAPSVMQAIEADSEPLPVLEAAAAEEPESEPAPAHPSTQPKPQHINIRVQNAMQAAQEHLDGPVFEKLRAGIVKAYGDVLTPQFSVKMAAKLSDEDKEKIIDVATALVAQAAPQEDEAPAADAEQMAFE